MIAVTLLKLKAIVNYLINARLNYLDRTLIKCDGKACAVHDKHVDDTIRVNERAQRSIDAIHRRSQLAIDKLDDDAHAEYTRIANLVDKVHDETAKLSGEV